MSSEKMAMLSKLVRGLLVSACAVWVASCGVRDPFWDAAPPPSPRAVALSKGVAIHDASMDELMVVAVKNADLGIQRAFIPVGENVTDIQVSPDGERVFVLSEGVRRRLEPEDQGPRLSVIHTGEQSELVREYELSDPLGGIAVDPRGEWIVLYSANGVVDNPNELVLVPVSTLEPPVKRSIRSFGGRPQRVTFTDELQLAGGRHRLLLVETEFDLTILDLENPDAPEVTLLLPNLRDERAGKGETVPAQVVFHDGDPSVRAGALLAIRLHGQSDVVIAELAPPEPDSLQSFSLLLTIADVGGAPSAIEFVDTDAGLQLAALVPRLSRAVLVDPGTSAVTHVPLPAPFSRMERVTDSLSLKPDVADVALLWGPEAAETVGFWALGRTAGQPYRSVATVNVGADIARVWDIPGARFAHMKLLEGVAGREFFALDLEAGTSSPLVAEGAGFKLDVARDGERAWAVLPGDSRFSMIHLEDLHPKSMYTELPVAQLFDVARLFDEGRAAVALHADPLASLTLFDGENPDSTKSRHHGQLFLGGRR